MAAFKGIENYKKLFHSREINTSFINSIVYAVFLVVYQVGLGTAFAFILTQSKIRGKLIFRNVYFIPVLLSVSVVSQLWIQIYNAEFGLINQLAKALQIDWSPELVEPEMDVVVCRSVCRVLEGYGLYHADYLCRRKEYPGNL